MCVLVPVLFEVLLEFMHEFQTRENCKWEHAPGAVACEDGDLKLYEVDEGIVQARYWQKLAILGNFFLDHETCVRVYSSLCSPYATNLNPRLVLRYGTIPILCNDRRWRARIFSSKKKTECKSVYNLAHLLTPKQHQKKVLGRFLIELSYELSR